MEKLKTKNIKEIVNNLKNNKVVALPTDTIYGFSCLPTSETAVKKLCELKQCDNEKLFIILVYENYDLTNLLTCENETLEFIKNNTPNPLTFIVNKNTNLKLAKNFYLPTLAIRIPKNKFLQSILKEVGFMISTSCNIHGKPNLLTCEEIEKQFPNLDCIVETKTSNATTPSTIVDITTSTYKIIRQGDYIVKKEFSYEDILNDKKIIKTINKIDNVTKYVVSHGMVHTMHVLDFSKNIAQIVNFSEHEKKLLYISAVLHDIGRVKDNKNHNVASVKIAKKYLKNKLNKSDIEEVLNAIYNHCCDINQMIKPNKISWALKLADKMDIIESRLLPQFYNGETHIEAYKNIKNSFVSIEDETFVLNFEVKKKINDFFENVATAKRMENLFLPATQCFGFKKFKINQILTKK